MKKKFLERFKVLKKALPYAAKQKKIFITYIFLNILMCVLGAVVPLFTAQQLLKLTDGLLNDLFKISVLVLGIQMMMNIIRYFSRKNTHRFFHLVSKDVQVDLAQEVMEIECKDLDKHSSGVFIDRLVKDTTNDITLMY